ncbi:uncharacterized protein N7446_009740 [Penicillium canescens]|uniref:Uncharacterized protein n=1 Tax=Penicillium canescens TaxID=5083 RepID=A0AAD6I6X0_PENCN|nr:uncharacterized protein N7446_009740 [Penicillium canescens]KAJ6034981.1 hypothetical protein N7460_009156 [Penicillium canescens]KAJ6046644.1 hypothetical protein N7444_007898 [Penicillium canescens]KAJ6053728.1 hypothetical protein N7446_009740 [Penicillium canescens]
MQLLSVFGALALVPAVISSPATGFKLATRDDDRGSQTVPGLGTRKQAVIGAGGNTRDMAIAMLETDTMTTDYTYGDGKTGDGTNFGIFKQNWYMLRTSASEFLGESMSQVADGAILNSDLGKDIRARHDGENKYGFDVWFAGHRNGQSGVESPNSSDITGYKDAVLWIQQQIESDDKYQSDDTRFWVKVKAI